MKTTFLLALLGGWLAVTAPPDAVPAPAAGAQTRYILLLHSYDHEFAPFDTVAEIFRTELNRLSPEPIVFLEVSLGPNPDVASPQSASLLHYLNATFAGRPLDLIVPIGGPAAMFAEEHRQALFPTTPVLYAAVDTRMLEPSGLTERDTAVAVANDPLRLMRSILDLRRDTTHVLVVIGNSPLEQLWKAEFRREYQPFTNRVTFEWADQYSFAQLRARAASLPAHWVIFYVMYSVDVTGGPYTESQVLGQLHAVASAPMFGVHSTQLGAGIVGGPLMPIEQIGETASDVALRMLRGESPSSIHVGIQEAGAPTFDWRELRRWNIDEAALPSGSIIRFREPTFWQQYKMFIMSGAALVILQTLLVLLLITNRFRRRRAEMALIESEARFRLLANNAPVMIWIADPDGRCTDFNRPWLQFTGRPLSAQLGDGWMEGIHPADRHRCETTFREALEQREPFEQDYRLRRADGQYRWILDCGVPRFNPAGAFAGYVGSAIDITEQKLAKSALAELNIKLLEAHEAERARLARELHDDLAQRTSGLNMVLRSLTRRLGHQSHTMAAEFTRLCNEFSELTRDIASLSHQLHPAPLELLGLVGAAESLCAETSQHHGIGVDFIDDAIPPHLPKSFELAMFRVLQEALNNVVQHAGAEHVRVTLLGDGDLVRLTVADDGTGFDPNEPTAVEGIGLITMRERVELLNGELRISSRRGAGTIITAVARHTDIHAPSEIPIR